jgi:hypothetical protein
MNHNTLVCGAQTELDTDEGAPENAKAADPRPDTRVDLAA